VEYALTPLGESLGVVLDALQRWADDNIAAVLTAQAEYDARKA
jgi:DNA-binding HxlR family transcriptional regulator